MHDAGVGEDVFIDFDAYSPRPGRAVPAVEAFGVLLGMVSFVVLTGIVLGRR